MSLTSRVSNLFSSGSTNAQRDLSSIALGEDVRNTTFTDIRPRGLGSETMASKAIEEEDRPPYLHVGKLVPN